MAAAKEKAAASAADAASDDLVEATVAPGRTVHVDTRKGPGETVRLPADEIERLIALGFLVDPAAPAPVAAPVAGPTTAPADGPSVTTVSH